MLAGRLEEAAEIYQRLMPDHADSWRLLRPYARLLWNRQQRDQALCVLDRAVTLAPDEPELSVDRADYCFALGNIEEAAESMRHAAALAPSNPDYLVKLALILLQRRDKSGARTACKNALALAPNLKSARHLLGDLAWQDGDFETAIQNLSISRQIPNPETDVNAALASSLFALGRITEITGFPDPVTAGQRYLEIILRAVFNWQMGNFERCELLVRNAARLLPHCSEAPRVSQFHRLERLLRWLVESLPENEALYQARAEAPLFVVGDNQGLPAAHLTVPFHNRSYRLRGLTVAGLRMADIVTSDANAQSKALRGLLDRLPAGVGVLLSAGSADLHAKGSVLARLRTDSDSALERHFEELVAAYLNRTCQWCERFDLKPAYLIPPHSNASLRKIDSADRKRFLAAVGVLASVMRRRLSDRGLTAIDLWAATKDEGGKARHDCFIDQNHVAPTAIIEAFRAADGSSGAPTSR